MGVIPEKKDYKNVSDNMAEYLAKQLISLGYEFVSRVKPNDRSHFDRYGFVKEQKRVIIVYDIKAKILSVTAFEKQFNEIKTLCDKLYSSDAIKNQDVRKSDSIAKSNKKDDAQGKSPKQDGLGKKTNIDKPVRRAPAGNVVKHSEAKSPENKEKPVKKSERLLNVDKTISEKKIKTDVNVSKNGSSNNVKQQSKKTEENNSQKSKIAVVKNNDNKEESKNDFTLRKYSPDRFDSAIENLKRSKIKIKLKETQGASNETVNIYEMAGDGNKITVRFMPHKRILQIQGKATDFLRKIQTVFSEGVDFKSALNAHIEQKQTDTRAADIERQLKKYLPTGILFLSSQAKIDFSIGIVDLLPGEIVLSDYSSLLIPPYRGLETLIFDLQRAQGIKVKMIGQAFEKDDDGNYILKASYRRKIGSVIFAEVMASLYIEYNSTRNFYVHSAFGPQTKVIADKNQAIAIYERMLKVVEYNAKKLKEIGFSL